jgi:hypothetical protein
MVAVRVEDDAHRPTWLGIEEGAKFAIKKQISALRGRVV